MLSAFVLASCKGTNDKDAQNTAPPHSAASETAAPTETPTAAPETEAPTADPNPRPDPVTVEWLAGEMQRRYYVGCMNLELMDFSDIDEIPLVYESSDAPSFEEEEDEELPVSGKSEYATGIDFERVLEALSVIHRNASSIAERQRAGETLTELEGTRLMETLRSDKVRSSTIDDIVRNRFEELYVPSDGRDKE